MVTGSRQAILRQAGLTARQQLLKRCFDIVGAIGLLLITAPIILIAYAAASIDTHQNGFFSQTRIGRFGQPFKIIKIRTMRDLPGVTTSVTRANDPRITRLGQFLRRSKIDELPQLINVLRGDMSFVGPRPDVPGFADCLLGDDRIILSVRPGITGPASLKFRLEQEVMAQQTNPERYNREVIYPEKVRLNCHYVQNYSFWVDLKYMYKTIRVKSWRSLA
jgi:lipopolysaccharide/colanic/teichoic acid biosynthesis glycosyltransferase